VFLRLGREEGDSDMGICIEMSVIEDVVEVGWVSDERPKPFAIGTG